VLHADHGFNASTFSARVTASTLSDMHSAITSAVGTLKGPLHGGANEAVMHMLEDIGSAEKAEQYIVEKLGAKEKIPGFGHRIYKVLDPRAPYLKDMSHRLGQRGGNLSWYDMSTKIQQKVKAMKGLDANVDFYSASTYHSMGIATDLFTPIFALSRVAGWSAHVMEQLSDNRLYRPDAEYVGPDRVEYVPIEKRQ
jgi:citrate synthase